MEFRNNIKKYRNNFSYEAGQTSKTKIAIRFAVTLAVYSFVLTAVIFNIIISPPDNFQTNSIFSVHEGQTFDEVVTVLKENGYLRSKILAKVIHRLVFLEGNGAVAGDYVFEEPLNAFSLIKRIDSGDFNLDQIRITIPEGLNKYETAKIFGQKIPDFDEEKFILMAEEGFLFPDTYFFPPQTSVEKILEVMKNNFDRKINVFLPDIEKSGRSFEEIITMASIVETEARQFETRRMVAGVLWNRIDNNMPLQVDVSFKYVNGKNTFDLTLEDLEIDSPYNTYKYLGLPPTPIANPGLSSIEATLTPEKSDYLFFLTGHDGVMYYAKDFEEHKKNRELYFD
jgi:UPF0755 protein